MYRNACRYLFNHGAKGTVLPSHSIAHQHCFGAVFDQCTWVQSCPNLISLRFLHFWPIKGKDKNSTGRLSLPLFFLCFPPVCACLPENPHPYHSPLSALQTPTIKCKQANFTSFHTSRTWAYSRPDCQSTSTLAHPKAKFQGGIGLLPDDQNQHFEIWSSLLLRNAFPLDFWTLHGYWRHKRRKRYRTLYWETKVKGGSLPLSFQLFSHWHPPCTERVKKTWHLFTSQSVTWLVNWIINMVHRLACEVSI